ncbi:MAG: CHAT domain-containing tetratricopeptide repeat protein [Cyanobacteria bacterium P01_E01_bin.6]
MKGDTHQSLAEPIYNLAELYRQQGRYLEAEPLYQEALTILDLHFGETLDTAATLHSLGLLSYSLEQYSDAENYFQRSLEIVNRGYEIINSLDPALNAILTEQIENTFLETSPAVYVSLAGLYHKQQEYDRAFSFLKQAIDREEASLVRNLVAGSDADKQNYLKSVVGTTNVAISLHLNHLSTSTESAELALSTILQRKGRVLDLFTNLRAQLADDPTAVELFDELREASNRLSTLAYNLSLRLSAQERRTQIGTLQERIGILEDQLSRRSSEFAELTTSPTLEDIQSLLPSDTVLIDFIRYQPLVTEAGAEDRFAPPRYAAYLFHTDGTVQGIDLGSAVIIDEAVKTLSRSLASPDTPLFQVKENARSLDALVMAPVRDALGDIKTLYISPDSTLNLLPFEALVDESGSYLIETYQFRYLTSGRDLLRIRNSSTSTNPALLIGNPAYSRPGETIAQADSSPRRSINLGDRIFPSLPGTQEEVVRVASLLPNAEVYTQANATEAAVKQQSQPSILHIATHGFFEQIGEIENPLLRSGLILAGASESQSGPEQDGILTALEVTELNLQDTQLVVLSACETGLGELAFGEGLYGLRRALVLAGSQSQVISLWKVDDSATQELMVNYYDRLLANAPRDAALRDTQLAFLESEDYSHPYYWTAFIGSGDWRSLQMN